MKRSLPRRAPAALAGALALLAFPATGLGAGAPMPSHDVVAGGAAAPAATAGATSTPAATVPASTTPATTIPPTASTTPATTIPPTATTTPAGAATTPATTTLTPTAQGTPGTATTTPGAGTAATKTTAKSNGGGVSGWAILAAALGALIVIAVAVWAVFRWGAYEPHWLVSARHSTAEAGYRASATWAEFTDWARLGH